MPGLLQHAPLVLHDMAALVAESVAAVYLTEVRDGLGGAARNQFLTYEWAQPACMGDWLYLESEGPERLLEGVMAG